MEVLLSYIEFTQFQNYLLGSMSAPTESKMKQIEFPSNIPISAIIEAKDIIKKSEDGDELLAAAKIKAYKLHNKYSRIGAEFEINISYAERERLNRIIATANSSDTTKNELFLMFEPANEAMMVFLKYSFSRFKASAAWKQRILPLFPNAVVTTSIENEIIDTIMGLDHVL